MKKFMMSLAALASVCGCATLEQANLDWIPIGPDFPATKAKNVEILGSKGEIIRPYGNLGLLRIKNLKPERDTLKMGVEKGRRFVASKGADAMLIGQYNSAEDGASNPRVTLIIYAIKYVDNLTEEDEKAIEDFKVLGILNERSDS